MTWEWEELEEAKQLDGEPGCRDRVVHVVLLLSTCQHNLCDKVCTRGVSAATCRHRQRHRQTQTARHMHTHKHKGRQTGSVSYPVKLVDGNSNTRRVLCGVLCSEGREQARSRCHNALEAHRTGERKRKKKREGQR